MEVQKVPKAREIFSRKNNAEIPNLKLLIHNNEINMVQAKTDMQLQRLEQKTWPEAHTTTGHSDKAVNSTFWKAASVGYTGN